MVQRENMLTSTPKVSLVEFVVVSIILNCDSPDRSLSAPFDSTSRGGSGYLR
jgi:hypothetical protein